MSFRGKQTGLPITGTYRAEHENSTKWIISVRGRLEDREVSRISQQGWESHQYRVMLSIPEKQEKRQVVEEGGGPRCTETLGEISA